MSVEIQIRYQRKVILQKNGQVLEQTAQGDGVTVPRGVQEMCQCGNLRTWFSGHSGDEPMAGSEDHTSLVQLERLQSHKRM